MTKAMPLSGTAEKLLQGLEPARRRADADDREVRAREGLR